MTIEDIVLLSIGILLILGSFVSAWIFFRILKKVDQQQINNPPPQQSAPQSSPVSVESPSPLIQEQTQNQNIQ